MVLQNLLSKTIESFVQFYTHKIRVNHAEVLNYFYNSTFCSLLLIHLKTKQLRFIMSCNNC